jgi:hypothetical protein
MESSERKLLNIAQHEHNDGLWSAFADQLKTQT